MLGRQESGRLLAFIEFNGLFPEGVAIHSSYSASLSGSII